MKTLDEELAEREAVAWRWLLSIKRLPLEEAAPDFRRLDRQVSIRICPGVLGAHGGAPGVRVTVDVGGRKRIRGSGNSLAEAACRLWRNYPKAELPELPGEIYTCC